MPLAKLLDHASNRAAHLNRTFFVLPNSGFARIRTAAPSGAWFGYVVTPAGDRISAENWRN